MATTQRHASSRGSFAADFSHADKLIARANKPTRSGLDEAPDLPKPERFLSIGPSQPATLERRLQQLLVQ